MKYEKPEMELIELAIDTIIRTSTTGVDGTPDDNEDTPFVPGTPTTTSF